MRTKLHSMWLTSALLLTSCSSLRVEKEVVARFAQLRDTGQLPGFARHDHGNLRTQAMPLSGGFSHPGSVTVHATKERDPAKYTYMFTKESSKSAWRLTAAWRTSPDGQREELTLK